MVWWPNYVKKNHVTKCYPPPSGNRTWASHNLWFQVQHYPFYTNLTFACRTETLGSLYTDALLIPLKSSKSKYQVVHKQKFKDLLSSTGQVSVERIDLFHVLKPLMPILALLPILTICEKPEWKFHQSIFQHTFNANVWCADLNSDLW